MARTVRDEITYPCPLSEGCIVEVLVLINNLIPHFIIGVICYPCWDYISFLLVNGGPWGFGIGIRLVKQYMDFKKTPVKCHKFTWASVTTFIENIWPIRYKGILIAKLINCLMHLKIWPWSVSQVFFSFNLLGMDGIINQYTIWCFVGKKYPIKTFHGKNRK